MQAALVLLGAAAADIHSLGSTCAARHALQDAS